MSIKNYTQQLRDEWKVVLCGVFRPAVIIPLCLTVISLYFANAEDIDKRSSLVLQVVALLSLTVASGCFWDTIKTATGNVLLVKKGLSAVRNLALARLKIKNISGRANGNSSAEEIKNLLSLLEKDIANAIQEWNDIFPSINAQEEIYALLAEKEAELKQAKKEKEAELELAKQEKEQINKKLEEEKQLSAKEKQSLNKKLIEKTQKILDLEGEVSKLQQESKLSPRGMLEGILLKPFDKKTCQKCGKVYLNYLNLDSILGREVCLDCQQSSVTNMLEDIQGITREHSEKNK